MNKVIGALGLCGVLAMASNAVAQDSGVSSGTGGTEVHRFVSNGAYADVSFSANGTSCILWAGQAGSGRNVQTSVTYHTYQCTYSDASYTCWGTNGWGTASGSVLQVSEGHAHLRVDTSAGGFTNVQWSYTCDNATGICTNSESAVAGGLIDVSWKKNNEYRQRSMSRTETDFVNYTYMFEGSLETLSANANGNMFSIPISAAGYIGTSRNRTMSIVRK